MPSTKDYRRLHEQVVSRPGAAERLAALREETLAEIGLDELRRALQRSQTELAAEMGITQSAVSQLERGGDVKVSTLRNYVRGLGAELQIAAVFGEGDDETVVPIHIGAGEG
jgi:DNA-binding XRE family transcriptional regulator